MTAQTLRVAVCGCAVLVGGAAHGQEFILINSAGDSAPDANGQFSSFGNPIAINDSGQVMFLADLSGTSGGSSDDRGIFVGDGTTTTQVAREGALVPNGNGTLNSVFQGPRLNNAGGVAFANFLNATSGGSADQRALFLSDGATMAQLARGGDPAPVGAGTFHSVNDITGLNNAGQVSFRGVLTGVPSSENTGIYRAGPHGVIEIAREGDLAPDGFNEFTSFGQQTFWRNVNDRGQVCYAASLRDATTSADGGDGFYRGSGGGVTEIVREGTPAPGGTWAGGGSLYGIASDGGVWFSKTINLSAGGTQVGAYVGDGTTIEPVLLSGQALPNGGAIGSFSAPVLSHAATHFVTVANNTVAGSDTALLISDGSATSEIMRHGDLTPDGTGTLIFDPTFRFLGVNDRGQAAFFCNIDTAGGTDHGIFFYDDAAGLVEVIRDGDAPFGDAVILAGVGPDSIGYQLNDRGQLVFHYTTLTGSGVAVWPTSSDPTFFVEPSATADADRAYRAATGAPITEFDFESESDVIDTLDLPDGVIDINLVDADLNPAAPNATRFVSAAFDVPDVFFSAAMLNRSAGGIVGSGIEFVFSYPVTGFGAFAFDDDNSSDQQFYVRVFEADGGQFVSPTLDRSNFAIEGFIGVTSTKGIERIIVQAEELEDASGPTAFELDHVQIGPPACAADVTRDGALNTNDFFAFLALYQTMDPAADFAPPGGDGNINTNDFFAFLAAYQEGCP